MNDPIEVEVVEIDGHSPPPPAPEPAPPPAPPWEAWQGRIRRLDGRWWPLWLVLGILAVGLLLTVGVVFGALVLVARLIGRLVGGVLGLFAGPASTTTLRR
ncbi:MAG TPA: hypothetical protein VIM46_06560 [Luteolibacter sp.]